MILEKAYAKVNCSYEALESGSEGDAFYDLTGCPPQELYLAWPSFFSSHFVHHSLT